MKKRILPLSCGMFTLFGASVVMAQEAPTADGKTDKKVTEMGEVVVTSQKREERLLDVPISITALSAEQLNESGIDSTNQLSQAVPGLTTVNNGLGFVPVIRGVSSQDTSPGNESNVAIYLDDIYIGAPLAGLFDLSDIERVEVLKGPQGTLFGRNATGGAIRIITRKPSFDPKASFSVDYGFDYDQTKVNAYVTGPLSKTIAGSLSATYHGGDGYIDGIGPNKGRTYGGPDNYLVRGKLLFVPSDNVEVTLTADKSRQKDDVVSAVSPPAGVDPYPGIGAIASQPFKYAGSTQPQDLVDSKSVSLDAKWDVNDVVSVRSITAYRDMDLKYQSDNDRTDQPILALMIRQGQTNFSQEFNVSGKTEAFDWVTGLYYYDSTAKLPLFAVIPGNAPNGTPATAYTTEVDTKSWAGFGDMTWNATDALHFTVGARYTSETKKFRYSQLVGAPLQVNSDKTWTSPTWRGIVRYDLNHDANVYLSVSNGFKSGSYNGYSSSTIPVSPEKLTAFELGVKAKVSDITLTAAAFNYDYKDIQVQSFATVGGAIVGSLQNAASAKMRGFEFSANGPVTDHFSFNAGVSLIPTAKFDSFPGAQVTIPVTGQTPILAQVVQPYDVSGSRIPRTPKWTANLGLTYATPLWNGYFNGTVSGFHSPGFYWQPAYLTREDAYNSVNARFAWTSPSGKFTYSVWGTNLTNADNSIYTVANVRGDSITFAQPRQIGIGFAVDL